VEGDRSGRRTARALELTGSTSALRFVDYDDACDLRMDVRHRSLDATPREVVECKRSAPVRDDHVAT
jgi:hypothetical protein